MKQEHSQSAPLLAHKAKSEDGHGFILHSEYKPTGDQPQAIEYLVKGINEGKKFQTLLGVTGSRKNRSIFTTNRRSFKTK